jgi:hypothetical protein
MTESGTTNKLNALGILRNNRGVRQTVHFIACSGCGQELWSFQKYKYRVDFDLRAIGWGQYQNIWYCPSCLEIAKQRIPVAGTLWPGGDE